MAPDAGVSHKTGPFKKADRVLRRSEYQSIYRRCEPMHTQHLVFYACQGEAGSGRRLGCTVPKKVGKAVVRNRLKRFLREAFRRHRDGLPEGCTVVANAKRSAGKATYAEVERAFERVAERLAREGYPPCAP
jgi:ribonuclease P protein component